MLGSGWKRGQATIVASEVLPYALLHQDGFAHYDVVADVSPDEGGGIFRAKFRDSLHVRFASPIAGAVMPVRFKGDKVEFDDATMEAALRDRREADAARLDELATEPPGTPTSVPGKPSTAAMADDLAATSSRIAATTGTLSDTVAAIRAARERGDAADVRSLKESFLAGRNAPPHGSPGADRLAQLQQLADLRDRGALTEAEFASEKARLLAEP